jgi:hypothetical protein
MVQTRFPDAPPEIAKLRLDERGFPVPYFVPWIDGRPEFRAVDPRHVARTDRLGLCWICGGRLAGLMCFAVGPMCTVNRLSAEPPSHLSCARFAVVACPFLSRPLAKRADASDLPHQPAAGIMLEHNPGVTALWRTRSYRSERDGRGLLFRMGPPVRVDWFTEGRAATRAEALAGFRLGLPRLVELADLDGAAGRSELARLLRRAHKWLPAGEEPAP